MEISLFDEVGEAVRTLAPAALGDVYRRAHTNWHDPAEINFDGLLYDGWEAA